MGEFYRGAGIFRPPAREERMREYAFALVVHERTFPFEALKPALKDMAISTWSCASCREASDLLEQTHPHLIFTDVQLPDGSWQDVLNLSQRAGSPVNVIVVSANEDTRTYLNVLEQGAFDYLAPPFERMPLEFVVRSAVEDVRARRDTLARAAVA